MRDSAPATIRDYLRNAHRRLDVENIEDRDLEKVLEKMEKAEEEIQKVLGNEE